MIKNFSVKCALLSLTFTAQLLHAEGVEEWPLALQQNTLADLTEVHLTEIVDHQQTSPKIIEKYGTLTLKADPISGGISSSRVLAVLNHAGADLSKIVLVGGADQMVQEGPDASVIRQVRHQLIEELAEKHGCNPEDISVRLVDIPKSLPKPHSYQELKVSSEGSQAHVSFLGVRGAKLDQVTFKTEVKVKLPVLVTETALPKDHFVKLSDFRVEKRTLRSSHDLVDQNTNLTERRCRLPVGLNAGVILKWENLYCVPLLNKGDIVTLLTKDNYFQVKTLGRVTEVLDSGSIVRVENIDSKKQITGRPLNAREVEVVY